MTFFLVLSSLISLISFAVFLLPVFLYFKNRNNTNFAKQIRIIAMVDVLYLALWIWGCISTGSLVQSAGSVIMGILSLVLPSVYLFCVWKMKAGTTIKSLFKNPGINGVLFFIYMLTNFVILYQLVITLLNYLIFGVAFIAILWIIDRFLGPNLLGGSSGNKKNGIMGTCGTCARFIDGKCAENPGAMIDPTEDSCSDWRL